MEERFASGDVCLCIHSPRAAENAGASETQIRHRVAEVYQLQVSMHVVLEAIREFNAPAAYRFANGQVFMPAWTSSWAISRRKTRRWTKNQKHASFSLVIRWIPLMKRYLILTKGSCTISEVNILSPSTQQWASITIICPICPHPPLPR